MERIVDIETDGLYLAINRGFLTISKEGEEIGHIALDDIGALIVHAHGIVWANSVFVRLSERNIPIVLCGSNHAPVSLVYPLEGHHRQAARMQAQISVTKPLKKQLWAQIVKAKIKAQGSVLKAIGKHVAAMDIFYQKVQSGDPDNIEAQAARRYWKELFGDNFRRDKDGADVNALLNYGYTIIRSVLSRAICASGLCPTFGIFHSNQNNAFALSDDLMEPYRPLVDMMVYNLAAQGKIEICKETKQKLASLAMLDLETPVGMSPLSVQAGRFAYSLVLSFEQKRMLLELPVMPTSQALSLLGHDEVVNDQILE